MKRKPRPKLLIVHAFRFLPSVGPIIGKKAPRQRSATGCALLTLCAVQASTRRSPLPQHQIVCASLCLTASTSATAAAQGLEPSVDVLKTAIHVRLPLAILLTFRDDVCSARIDATSLMVSALVLNPARPTMAIDALGVGFSAGCAFEVTGVTSRPYNRSKSSSFARQPKRATESADRCGLRATKTSTMSPNQPPGRRIGSALRTTAHQGRS